MFFFDWYYGLVTGILSVILVGSSASAHTVKVSGDVAVTFHIEPNHNPKAGKPSQAWFALTRQGGKPIPLEQCDCRLVVHSQPHREEESPLLTPALKPLTTAPYPEVPSAILTFPQSGAYELELSGKPKAGATFRPFVASYAVTVLAGTATSSTSASPIPASPSSTARSVATDSSNRSTELQWVPFGIGGTLLAAAMIGWMMQRSHAKRD
ncbi:MAG TPA: hypothetical protein V6D19_23945 [Stenomitos sp.]